jgi:hypothetical protein
MMASTSSKAPYRQENDMITIKEPMSKDRVLGVYRLSTEYNYMAIENSWLGVNGHRA